MPRTNYDTRETPGVAAYRRRRARRLKRKRGSQAKQTARFAAGEPVVQELTAMDKSVRQNEHQFKHGAKMKKRQLLNRKKAGPIRSGEANFGKR